MEAVAKRLNIHHARLTVLPLRTFQNFFKKKAVMPTERYWKHFYIYIFFFDLIVTHPETPKLTYVSK